MKAGRQGAFRASDQSLRHALPESVLAAGWRDVDHLRDGLSAFSGKLAAVGLVLNRRATGLRITKTKSA